MNVYSAEAESALTRLRRACDDLGRAARLFRLWLMLGWVDVRQRYRRALIGPFWITLSMAVMVGSMGVVYGSLFQQNETAFLPYLASGFVAWFFISSCISESANAFIQSEGLIKQGGLPLGLHICRIIWRNVIVWLHNCVVMLGIYAWLGAIPLRSLPLIVPGMALTIVNLTWIALILAPLCTRFRDLAPIVANLLQMLFFVTPVIYKPESLHSVTWIVDLNPFYYMLQAIRGPMLGEGLPLETAGKLLLMAAIGWPLAAAFFARCRGRIAFWI